MNRRDREGSALVATLLFMALMLGLLLYYTALVRMQSDVRSVERSIFLSRQAVHTGIAMAMAEMSDSYGNPTNRVYSLRSQRADWVSVGTGGPATNWVSEILAETMGWPDRLRGTGVDSLHERASRADWVVQGDPGGIHTVYAWAGVDLTGLIDPNDVGALSTSPLGFSGSTNRVFLTAREFAEAQPGAEPVFVPGQYSLDQGWYNDTTGLWQTNVVAGEETVSMDPWLWTSNHVQAVMEELFPDKDAEELAVAFDDFRNAREVPTDPEALTAVAVPMINEVTATLRVRNTGGTVTVTNRVDIEVWYPFPDNVQTNRYHMPLTPVLMYQSGAASIEIVPSQVPEDEWDFPDEEVSATLSEFTLLTMETPGIPIPSVMEGDVLNLEWDLGGLELERLDGSGPVDRLPAGLTLVFPAVTVPIPGDENEVSATIEVTDPRLNHEPGQWLSSTNASILAVNAAALQAQAADEFTDPLLCWAPDASSGTFFGITWAERIGHFPIGEPWKSFSLFDDEGQWWMRHTRPAFWVPETGPSRNRLNPNSSCPRALAAAFHMRRLRETPLDSGTALSMEEAELLAGDLDAAVRAGNGFTRRGDWSWALEARLLELAGDGGRHAAESVLAQSLPWLSTRSRVWGILVSAETRAPGGEVLAGEQRVVTVWSDPHAGSGFPLRFQRMSLTPFPKP